MTTDNERNYNQDDYTFNPDNQSYIDQYEQENSDEETAEPTENENLDTEFSNALDLDDFENDFDENDEQEEDPKENEEENEEENYDQEEITEPDTFADDGYKID